MAKIYANVALTIIASSPFSPNVTIYTERKPSYRHAELKTPKAEPVAGVALAVRRAIPHGFHAKVSRAIDPDPLDLRAWALQERQLATRLVSFTSSELQ
jgi:hypothetical protein